jgi:hypothetical protein
MGFGGVIPTTTKAAADSGKGGRRRPAWGALYSVTLIGAILCLVGYRLETSVGQATLLQSAVVVIVLGLLCAWTRVHRSFLLDQTPGLQGAPRRTFSIIRVPFSRASSAVRHQPNELSVARRGRRSSARPPAHSSLR